MEYIIELVDQNNNVVAVGSLERNKRVSYTKPTTSAYQYCTKFKVSSRAEAIANQVVSKYKNEKNIAVKSRIALYSGVITSGSKSTVAPKQADRIRRN